MNQPTTWWACGIAIVFSIALYQLQVSDPLTIENQAMKTGESVSVTEQALSEDYYTAYEKMVDGELKDLLNDAVSAKVPARPAGFERSPRVVQQFRKFPTNADEREAYFAARG